MTDLANMRQRYNKFELLEADADANPFQQFSAWFHEATQVSGIEANAMTLATVNAQQQPEARIVLLKSFDDQGFVFFTNYESHKGQALSQHPYASLLFFWYQLERQVRISGPVSKISEAESDAYFKTRPLDSQLGAWASPQSHVTTHEALEQQLQAFRQKFGDEVPRPPHWGGFRVQPERFEFWQGRPSRLHDRLIYTKDQEDWHISRLAP
ncbi:pyridoxamine 5'-phosphate oxidase [Brackiella oedipodis]|uniref:pyridoxamine 5'-phosphate oxidase n=1 Tax=Brackiella oedipodis TaxID=124225 RepID=UPI00048DE585|nr:pyridoxamine 5'-phosphate oxidase [Brackiella oedipodis]